MRITIQANGNTILDIDDALLIRQLLTSGAPFPVAAIAPGTVIKTTAQAGFKAISSTHIVPEPEPENRLD